MAAGNLTARYAHSKGVIGVEDLAKWLDDLPAEPKGGHRTVNSLDDDKGVTTNDTLNIRQADVERAAKGLRNAEPL